jgi:hypothetical protein
VVWVKLAGEHALFVKILVWDDEHKMAAGSDELPPIQQRFLGIVHVFQAVGRVDIIKLLVDIFCNFIGVPIPNIKPTHPGKHRIKTASDIYPFAGKH